MSNNVEAGDFIWFGSSLQFLLIAGDLHRRLFLNLLELVNSCGTRFSDVSL